MDNRPKSLDSNSAATAAAVDSNLSKSSEPAPSKSSDSEAAQSKTSDAGQAPSKGLYECIYDSKPTGNVPKEIEIGTLGKFLLSVNKQLVGEQGGFFNRASQSSGNDQKGESELKGAIGVSTWKDGKNRLEKIINVAFAITQAQPFRDGNHRTAASFIQRMLLAEANVCLKNNKELASLIKSLSDRYTIKEDEVIAQVVRYIKNAEKIPIEKNQASSTFNQIINNMKSDGGDLILDSKVENSKKDKKIIGGPTLQQAAAINPHLQYKKERLKALDELTIIMESKTSQHAEKATDLFVSLGASKEINIKALTEANALILDYKKAAVSIAAVHQSTMEQNTNTKLNTK
jgi:hypothetical protein